MNVKFSVIYQQQDTIRSFYHRALDPTGVGVRFGNPFRRQASSANESLVGMETLEEMESFQTHNTFFLLGEFSRTKNDANGGIFAKNGCDCNTVS
jgi:hypothetical protein